MFSKLPVPRGRGVRLLDPDLPARSPMPSLTGGIDTQALQRIGKALIQAADAVPQPPWPAKAGEKMGAILNSSPSSMRDTVLEGLDGTMPASGWRGVRKTIFTWAHIPTRGSTRATLPASRARSRTPSLSKALGRRARRRWRPSISLGGISSRLAGNHAREMDALGKVSVRTKSGTRSWPPSAGWRRRRPVPDRQDEDGDDDDDAETAPTPAGEGAAQLHPCLPAPTGPAQREAPGKPNNRTGTQTVGWNRHDEIGSPWFWACSSCCPS